MPLLVFLDKGVTFQPYVCNGSHDVLMISMNLRNIAILKPYGVNYRCIITEISKSEAISLLQKADLKAKARTLQNIKNFFQILKWVIKKF